MSGWNKMQWPFQVCLDATQQVQANSCRSMWPGNLTAGSGIWSPQLLPPEINTLHRIQEGKEEEVVGSSVGGCMWMVWTSAARKTEVGSFLRLCRALTWAETPFFSLSCFVFLYFFSLWVAVNFLRVREGEIWRRLVDGNSKWSLHKPWPTTWQTGFYSLHAIIF